MTNIGWSLSNYLMRTIQALVVRDIVTGLIKSLVFAVIITKIGCFEGFNVQGGAEGVGRATTSSVVKSIFAIIAADMIFTAVFYYLGGS
jgi:phospholipid/cholesterol/gamma-HCH transport system permease protein